MAHSLKDRYPWLEMPLVANAPMGGLAGPPLAIAVSKAAGFGFIGDPITHDGNVDERLREAAAQLGRTQSGKIPVGFGVLCFLHPDPDEYISAVVKHQPAAIWLFAAHGVTEYSTWTEKLRAHNKGIDVWIQTGSVAEALNIAKACRPDVLVVQGADAGGHGVERGASVVSLVPEVADALKSSGAGNIPLVASGGIVDHRGIAASVCLGASGGVMGTRFLASKEINISQKEHTDAILSAKDGGQCTVSSKLFDDLNARGNIWPADYDGRALKNASWRDMNNGMNIEENRKLHQEAQKAVNGGHNGEATDRRIAIWAGTGVGLVDRVEDAHSIVTKARDGAHKTYASSLL